MTFTFAHETLVSTLAEEFPEVYWIIIDFGMLRHALSVDMFSGYDTYTSIPRVQGAIFANDEAGYLGGIVAGCVLPF